MTWKELKDFCNNLPESQLEKKVILWREDEAITDIEAIELDEDYYIDEDNWDNGCVPESECQGIFDLNPEDYPNGLADLTKTYEKGTAILQENF